MIMGNTEDNNLKINPEGGYKHFGLVKGDFVVLKGSVPGTYRRLIKLRSQIRNAPAKISKPNILEVVV
jgi:large subunit ribosomal protein L3